MNRFEIVKQVQLHKKLEIYFSEKRALTRQKLSSNSGKPNFLHKQIKRRLVESMAKTRKKLKGTKFLSIY